MKYCNKDFELALKEYNVKNKICKLVDNKIVELLDDELNCNDDSNLTTLSEDSLQRTLKIIEKSSFAILTAYQDKFSKKENILRNRKLRAFLNKNKMGVHQLVGHYPEVQDDGSTVNVTERSYLIEKPNHLTNKEFSDIVISCLTIDNVTQNCALIKFDNYPNNYYLIDSNSMLKLIGTNISFNNIGQIYSQHVKKMNTSFKFESEERPNSMFCAMLYKKHGYVWSGHNGYEF